MKILGFDLGDGESAVTLLDEDSTVEPRVIPLCGKTSLLSAVGVKNGRIVIGEAASVMDGAAEAKVRFKSRYLVDPSAAGDVRAFAQGVVAELTRVQPALIAEVARTVVGCPAGWGEGRREQYAALLESAGFPNVSVVPEPRAAFLYARHARGLRVSPELMRRSAMVIDIGSSTTDFAYIVDGHQQNVSLFGDTNLGGGLIDELILSHAVAQSPDGKALAEVFEECPAWRSYCELEARRLKESYFLDEEKWADAPLRRQLTVCYDEPLALELSIGGESVREMIREPISALGGRSFCDCLEDALHASVEVSKACPPQVVILTGGASRMAFFQQACREAFDGALLVLCPEPECSIARGLAYAGRVDERLKVFRQEVGSIAHGEKLSVAVNASAHELYEPVAHALFEMAQESTVEAVGLWRKGGMATIDELDGDIQRRIARVFESDALGERLEGELHAWLDELMQTLEGELTSLCVRCGVPPEKMSLTGARLQAGVGGVKMSLLDAMGMDIFSGVMSVVLAVVGATLCGGGGMALVSAGPAGMAAGAAVGILIAILGKSGMEKALRKAKLPILMRRVVTDNAVRRGLSRQREEIERAIIQALANPSSGFAARLCQSLSQTLGVQMEQMARDAEMSICA